MNITIKKTLTIMGVIGLFGILPENLYAADTQLSGANTAWILTSTALVLFMTIPGLAFFYGGLVRSKNVLSVLMQCFALTCMVSILWVIVLYGLVFGDGGSMNSIIVVSINSLWQVLRIKVFLEIYQKQFSQCFN